MPPDVLSVLERASVSTVLVQINEHCACERGGEGWTQELVTVGGQLKGGGRSRLIPNRDRLSAPDVCT